jgi:hypothetical protein
LYGWLAHHQFSSPDSFSGFVTTHLRSELILLHFRLAGYCLFNQLSSIAADVPGRGYGCPQQSAQTRDENNKQPAHA